MSNPVIQRSIASIGRMAAEEDDEFLFECFFDHPALGILNEPESPERVLLGRTGAGKTAVLRKIERDNENSQFVDLLNLSFDYISNSTVFQFLSDIDADIDLLFQVMWRHVFVVEYVKMKYNVDNNEKFQFTLSQLREFISRDRKKNRFVEYVKKWEGRFWIDIDENVKEVTQQIEKKMEVEFGAEYEKIMGRAKYAKSLSDAKKSDFSKRFRNVVSSAMLSELGTIIDMLSSFSDDNKQKRYFILIDKLDERWIDKTIRFQLIRALVETSKTFKKIHNMKIIIALRNDVWEKTIDTTKDIGFQSEKYEDLNIHLNWSRIQLKLLVNKRINFLYKKKYTKENVFFEDIFPDKIGQRDTFSYIMDRTLMRPRDVISFVNKCFELSEGRSNISVSNVRKAELPYSLGRLNSLYEEWASLFPNLEALVRKFSGSSKTFRFGDLSAKELCNDLALEILGNSKGRDLIFKKCENYYDDNENIGSSLKFSRFIVSILYRVGVLGVKLASNDRYHFAHLDSAIIAPDLLKDSTRIQISPIYWQALGIVQERS